MTAPALAAAPKGRLGNGQLRRQVAQHLADNPEPCKTGEIARALGRSAGTVGNALTTLADRGEADPVPGKPIRYQANAATAAAAAAIAPKAPAPPKATPAPPEAAPAPKPAPAPAPSPAPKPAAPPAPAGPVTRPNGQVYQPRALADMPDVEALRRLRAAGSAAALILAREDAGILEPAETAPVAAKVEAAIGPARLRATWREAHQSADGDARTLTRLARRWCRILGLDPDAAPPAPAGTGISDLLVAIREAIQAISDAVEADFAPPPPLPHGAAQAGEEEKDARDSAGQAARDTFGRSARPPR